MKLQKITVLSALLLCSANLLGQNREAIVEIVLVSNPDTMRYENGQREEVVYSVINHGPDTIKPTDRFGIVLKHPGWNNIAQYINFGTTLAPQDSQEYMYTYTVSNFITKEGVYTYCLHIPILFSNTLNDTLNPNNVRQTELNEVCYQALTVPKQTSNARVPIEKQGVEVYPNPTAHGFLTIKNASGSTLSVRNTQGQQVASTEIQTEHHQHETKDLPGGIYYLKVVREGQATHFKVLVL